MTRRWIVGSLVVACWLASAGSGFGQSRRYSNETAAVGLEAGAFIPHHVEFDVAPFFAGFFEYYVTPNVSLRPELGWAEAAHTGARVDAMRIVPLWLDLDHTWTGSPWRPFVGAGIGVYFLQAKRDGVSFGEGQSKPGVSVAGGIEYLFRRSVGLKAEVRYHGILRTVLGLDPSALALTGGLKAYF